MSSWIVEALNSEKLELVQEEASRRLLHRVLGLEVRTDHNGDLQFIADALELAVIDLLDNEAELDTLRMVSADAFRLLRVMPRPEIPMEAAKTCLRIACLGILGEHSTDVKRLLKETPWPILPFESLGWGERTFATIVDIWLRLIRKDGWTDLEEVQEKVISLRASQQDFEATYLVEKESEVRSAAWELMALYHLAKAAEILAIYTTQGQVDGLFDIRQQLEAQFDRALIACARAELMELEALSRLLAGTAQQLVDNCIWTVTRAVNSRVTKFVEHLVHKPTRPVFEMLPPQRRTLREQGLLGSGHRSVVVSLPTSSGKTFIAQFRILQALNQFEEQQGWIAYLVPTRALVNQVCARLRADFAALDINVERVSPALEVDAAESKLLIEQTPETRFRILVTTPEKLDLMLRGGWEEKIERPLTLVVVDEAHNLAQKERGLKLELLLATINRECRFAQFLLLTPFISNPDEIARWLSPDSYTGIELGLDWQPNDRAVVLSHPKQSNQRGKFFLEIETLHTNKHTIVVPEELRLGTQNTLELNWSKVKNSASDLAAVTAQSLKARGPVIVLASRPDWVWSLAKRFKHPDNLQKNIHPNVELVQRYLAYEFGDDFELCELLKYGVGIHHAGLSEEAKTLLEWLLESEHIQILVATTTIAQGVNFPVSSVVLAQNKYYDEAEGMVAMPAEDFWNLAGRVGRVEQGSVGIVALAAINQEKATELRQFVGQQVVSLNSSLISMVQDALTTWSTSGLHVLFHKPEWSAFLQYLAHTYRQIGDPNKFANQVEQVLRGTLGFQTLRRNNPEVARRFVLGVQVYGQRLMNKPLQLVDSTGFSWESVSYTLGQLYEQRITEDVWEPETLFRSGNRNLKKLMGILLDVPEIRDDLAAATGGRGPNGDLLAHMVSDWVNGSSIPDMAKEYFATSPKGEPVDSTVALTNCCRNLFGKLTRTTSWGLAALQAMTFKEEFDKLSESEQQTLRNLPARVFYGVNTNEAIALRLLGVPRRAAQPLAETLGDSVWTAPLPQLRATLRQSDEATWSKALGATGQDYRRVWQILEGIER